MGIIPSVDNQVITEFYFWRFTNFFVDFYDQKLPIKPIFLRRVQYVSVLLSNNTRNSFGDAYRLSNTRLQPAL